MFGLETAAGVFEQLAAEEAFGLVVFNVVIAPMAAPAVGLAEFAPAARRIKPYRRTGQHRRRFRPPTPDGRKSSANRWEGDPGSGAAPCSPGWARSARAG